MSAPWDQRLSNDATMAEKCMTLGAVILDPASKRPAGFAAAPVTPSPGKAQS